MATSDVFDAFRAVSETLSTDVYRNATWKSIWMNLIPRETYKRGSGLALKTYVAANSEPALDDESWSAIALASGTGSGSCSVSYQDATVGMTELVYAPEGFGIRGPTLCKDDLTFDHNVDAWLGAYLQELTKRANRTNEKRTESVYIQLSDKCVVSAVDGYATSSGTQLLYSNQVGLSGVSTVMTPAAAPTNNINQTLLDNLALDLINIGASDPDSNGFINLGEDGPLFPLYIHPDASKRIVTETAAGSTIRTDLNYGAPNEILKRMGATRIIRNFRHVPNLTPPRFVIGATTTISTGTTIANSASAYLRPSNGIFTFNQTVNFCTLTVAAGLLDGVATVGMPISLTIGNGVTLALGASSYIYSINAARTSIVVVSANAHTGGTSGTTTTVTTGTVGKFFRVATFLGQQATKGFKYVLSDDYVSKDIAKYEGAIVLSPRVVAMEVVPPTNSAAGVNWSPTNNMGEWIFRTGACNISAAANGSDPLDKLGAHYAEFKQAPRPMFPQHGKILIYNRKLTT
jgi:hypothetical protein